VGLLLVAGAAVAGFTAYRSISSGALEASAGAAGSSLPAPGAPAADDSMDGPTAPPATPGPRPIPTTLPEFTLADRVGVKRTLSHWRDRPLVVNFWATWCAPCRREIPLLRRLRAERRTDRLEVVGIAVDFRDAVLAYAQQMAIDYPILIGEQDGLEAAAAFGVDAVFPFTVFADRRHRIVAVKVGELHADEAGFILDRVEEIDTGRLDLAAARPQIEDRLRELAVARAQRPKK
jgi:thiol-disulfide isomerase/thioredoxin